MAAAFGAELPATGFALGIERVMLALERQGIAMTLDSKDVYVGWAENKLAEAIAVANGLRQSGQTTELGLMAQTKDQAAVSQQTKGYAGLVYIGE